MKILFYTSSRASFVDLYNISEVIANYPDFEYKIVEVRVKKKKIGLISKCKRQLLNFYFILRNGRNDLKKDAKAISNNIKPLINLTKIKKINLDYTNAVNDELSEKLISEFEPDYIIQSGAGILKSNIFTKAKLATLNVHHGFAPEIRGMQSTLWALYYGLKDKIGVTCHIIDECLDTGPVICQYNHEYNDADTFISIQTNLIKEGAKLLIKAINEYHPDEIFKTTSVKSFYFSYFDLFMYRDLKNSNFRKIQSIDHVKYKVLNKNIMVKN